MNVLERCARAFRWRCLLRIIRSNRVLHFWISLPSQIFLEYKSSIVVYLWKSIIFTVCAQLSRRFPLLHSRCGVSAAAWLRQTKRSSKGAGFKSLFSDYREQKKRPPPRHGLIEISAE